MTKQRKLTNFALTDDEKRTIAKAALVSGTTLSAFIREAALAKAANVRIKPNVSIKDLIRSNLRDTHITELILDEEPD